MPCNAIEHRLIHDKLVSYRSEPLRAGVPIPVQMKDSAVVAEVLRQRVNQRVGQEFSSQTITFAATNCRCMT
jgi:hypothetical protein